MMTLVELFGLDGSEGWKRQVVAQGKYADTYNDYGVSESLPHV